MIVRIVRMTFESEKITAFKEMFEGVKDKIRSFPGCAHLALLQGIGDEANVFMTYSHWNSESDLEAYRHSELFKETWKTTKAMFDDKPYAISLTQVAELV